MEVSSVCRICLSSKAIKDISDLIPRQNDHKTSADIVLFCLNIQINTNSNISTKLCLKCMKTIMSFYDFKLLALKNDAYLRNCESSSIVKEETFLDEDLTDEVISINSNDSEAELHSAELPLCADVKIETISIDTDNPEDPLSDEEFLFEEVKYEFIPDIVNETKENVSEGTRSKKKYPKSGSCTECGKEMKNLREHMQRHESLRDPNSRLPCSLCEKTFSSNYTRYQHQQMVHLGLRKPCPICKKLVLDLKSHTKHMHEQDNSKKPECYVCKKHFGTASALRTHEATHSTEKPFACKLCNRKFRLNGQLIQHKRRVHEKLRLALCHICSKEFSDVGTLRKHLRIHMNERPFKCKECGKAFTTSTARKNHMFVHTNKQPFKCEVCDMKFAAPRYLRNHMVTHTREKRYSCRFCEWKFHRSDHAKQHENAVHKIKNLIPSERQ